MPASSLIAPLLAPLFLAQDAASGRTRELLAPLTQRRLELDAAALAELTERGVLTRLGVAPRGHAGGVQAVSAGGAHIVSSGLAGDVTVWSATDGAEVATRALVADDDSASCVAARALGATGEVVCLWSDGTARIVDAATLTERRRFVVPAACEDLVLSADGAVLATLPSRDAAGEAARAHLFEAATGKALGVVERDGGVVVAAAFSADGARLATLARAGGGRAATCQLEVRDRQGDGRFGAPVHSEALTLASDLAATATPGVALSPDGARVAVAVGGPALLTLELARGKSLRPAGGADPALQGGFVVVAFARDGARLYGGTSAGEVVGFDVAGQKPLFAAQPHTGAVADLALLTDGSAVASVSVDGSLRLLDPRTGEEVHAVPGSIGAARALVFARDGALLAAGQGGALVRFDVASGAVSTEPSGHAADSGHGGAVLGLALDAAGRVLSAAADGVRTGDGGSRAALSPAPGGAVTAFVASADGATHATGHLDGTTRVWRGAELVAELTPEGAPAAVRAVGLAPDGATVMAVRADGRRHVWRVDGRRLVHEDPAAPAAADVPASIGWLDEGRTAHAFAGGSAGVERLDGVSLLTLEVARGERLATSPPPLAVAPGGTHVATLVTRLGLVVWDTATGEVALQLGHTCPRVTALVFSADGARIGAAHADGTLSVFDLEALGAWSASAEAPKGDAVASEGGPATPPTLGGDAAPAEAGVPQPDPDALRPRRRRVEPFEARVAAAEAAFKANDSDAAEESLLAALADLADLDGETDAAARAARALDVHTRLAALPGADATLFAAVADGYIEVARAYQRKGWNEVAALCLDTADLYGPGRGDRVRASLARAKPEAPKKADPKPKEGAKPATPKPAAPGPAPRPGPKPPGGAAAAPGAAAYALAAPSGGWRVEGDRTLGKPAPNEPNVVLVDCAPSEDVRIELEVEAGGSRRSEFGLVFGATEGLGSGYALMILHAENTNVIQSWLCELRGGVPGDKIVQRKLTLDKLPPAWKLAVEVKGNDLVLEVAGEAKLSIRTEHPAHGHHGFIRTAGGDTPTGFKRVRIDPPPGVSVAEAAAAGPPRVAPDAPIDVRVAAAEAHVPFGQVEGCVVHLLRARRGLVFLPDESLAAAQGARIDSLLETHDAMHARRERARADAAAALLAAARARLDAGRAGAALGLFELARLQHAGLAAEPFESARPTLDLALAKRRGAPDDAPRPLDNAALAAWFGEPESRQEFWTGGWSTLGASLASPLLVDASTLLRARTPLPAGVKEVSVEVRLENRGAAGLALGCAEDGSFLAVTFDPEAPKSSVTIARWTGAEGKGWDQRAAETQRHAPEAMDGWVTIAVRIDGTRITARVGRGEPVTASVPARWTEGSLGLLAIGQHGPQRVRFRNLVVQ